jgi:hypothetical protein
MIFPVAPFTNTDFVVDGADFDGSNDWMRRTSGFTGAANSTMFALSVWFRIDGDQADGSQFLLSSAGNSGFRLLLQTGGGSNIEVLAYDGSDLNVLDVRTTSTLSPGPSWRHLLMSFDLADPAKAHVYLDDVNEANVLGSSARPINFIGTSWAIAGVPGGTNKFDGCIAELWWQPGAYIDFSQTANRRLFRTAAGRPVKLGDQGQIPTGTAALVYSHLRNNEPTINFSINRGTGGSFTLIGVLGAASSSPSD